MVRSTGREHENALAQHQGRYCPPLCHILFILESLRDRIRAGSSQLWSILWLRTPQHSTVFHTLGFFDVKSKRLARGPKGRAPGPEPDSGVM